MRGVIAKGQQAGSEELRGFAGFIRSSGTRESDRASDDFQLIVAWPRRHGDRPTAPGVLPRIGSGPVGNPTMLAAERNRSSSRLGRRGLRCSRLGSCLVYEELCRRAAGDLRRESARAGAAARHPRPRGISSRRGSKLGRVAEPRAVFAVAVETMRRVLVDALARDWRETVGGRARATLAPSAVAADPA